MEINTLISGLENAGVNLNPKEQHFVYSHIPCGKLHTRVNGIEEKIYSLKPQEFSMYIHIPFCFQRCNYCGFISFGKEQWESGELIDSYLAALNKEMSILKKKVDLKRASIVYIGGGTPTLLNESRLEQLLTRIKQETEAEIEIEAHPASLTEPKLRVLKQFITRLSIGVQSFDDTILRETGRMHTSSEAKQKIELAMKYLDHVNVDLIYGLPHQTLANIISDVENVKGILPPSITWYQLWVRSRVNRRMLPIHPEIALSKKGFIAAKILVNEELEKLGYHGCYGNWYLRQDTPLPQYETTRVTAMNNVGLGISSYQFVEPYIFENTTRVDDYLRFVGNGSLPIQYWREMNEKERVIREFALSLKRCLKADNQLISQLPNEMLTRIEKLKHFGVIEDAGRQITINGEFGLTRDYIIKHLLGRYWWIRYDNGSDSGCLRL